MDKFLLAITIQVFVTLFLLIVLFYGMNKGWSFRIWREKRSYETAYERRLRKQRKKDMKYFARKTKVPKNLALAAPHPQEEEAIERARRLL